MELLTEKEIKEKLNEILEHIPLAKTNRDQITLKVIAKGGTNKRFNYENAEGKLLFNQINAEFYMRGIHSEYHTSYIKKLSLDGDILTVFTRNSEYKYQVLEDGLDLAHTLVFELSQEALEIIEAYLTGDYIKEESNG